MNLYYVYVAQCENGIVKVGMTANPHARLGGIRFQLKSPATYRLLAGVESDRCALGVERLAHFLLRADAIGGECYRVSHVRAANAVRKATRILGFRVAFVAFSSLPAPDRQAIIKLRGQELRNLDLWRAAFFAGSGRIKAVEYILTAERKLLSEIGGGSAKDRARRLIGAVACRDMALPEWNRNKRYAKKFTKSFRYDKLASIAIKASAL